MTDEPKIVIAVDDSSFRSRARRTQITRHTIRIPRESMRELVFASAKGTPPRGVETHEDETAPYSREDLERLRIEAGRAPTSRELRDHAIVAMTASAPSPTTAQIVRDLVRVHREAGIARAEVTRALEASGLRRLMHMNAGSGTEIYGAVAGDRPLLAIRADARVSHVFVRAVGDWIPYRVRSSRDVQLLAREVRK